jgi:hypothetical protein
MWFWPVNEMIELLSGMPAPQFGEESSLSARFRAGSRFKRFLCFYLIVVRCFHVHPNNVFAYPRLNTTETECTVARVCRIIKKVRGLTFRIEVKVKYINKKVNSCSTPKLVYFSIRWRVTDLYENLGSRSYVSGDVTGMAKERGYTPC